MVTVICGQLFSCQYAQVVSLTSQTQSLPSLICRAQGSPCRLTPTPVLTSTTRLSEACRVWDLWWPFRLESRQSVVQPELQSPQSTAWPPTAHLQERTKFQDSSHSANSKRPREAVLERSHVEDTRTSEVKSLPIVMLEPSFPEGLVVLGSRQHNVKPPGWWGSFRRKTEWCEPVTTSPGHQRGACEWRVEVSWSKKGEKTQAKGKHSNAEGHRISVTLRTSNHVR